MALQDLQNDGLFTRLIAAETAGTEVPADFSCVCGGCGSLGEGAIDPGAYATTPTSGFNRVEVTPIGTGGDTVAPLMAGSKWNSVDTSSAKTVVSFSFIDPAASTFSYGSLANFCDGASSFSDADKALTREILAKIAAVANIEFVEVADNAAQCGVLRYGYSPQPNAMGFAGYAFFPSGTAIGGDIWIGSNQAQAQWDFYRPNLLLHETLHSLGLKHPFSGGATLAAEHDIIPNTVMSYSPVAGGRSGSMSAYPAEPMRFDVAALHQLYGAASAALGDTTYDVASAEFRSGFQTVWDAGGTDTIDASHVCQGVRLDLAAGSSSDIGLRVQASASSNGTALAATYTHTLAIADGARIENATGSVFADVISGNAFDNILRGNAGDDQLAGGDGLDAAAYVGVHWQFAVQAAGGTATVTDAWGNEGRDTLSGIERLHFDDVNLALDIDGHAGQAAKAIGAVFGAWALDVPAYAGHAIELLDAGLSYQSVLQVALDVQLGRGAAARDVVELLYANVAGVPAPAADLAFFTSQIESGAMTAAGLAEFAAEHALNAQNIDLTGLAANGLLYA